MESLVLDLQETSHEQIGLVGGKAASLAELSRIEGIPVPAGFCVTTDAYRLARAGATALDEIEIPAEVVSAVSAGLGRHGRDGAWAVRSSSTAEDLAEASFAGQYDSFLNLVGEQAILEHVRECWASLFSERAVAYRQRNGIEGSEVAMAVVIQKMVPAEAAGVLFTADPVNSNRTVASIEAVAGLGEGLVSGRAQPASWKVRRGEVIERSGQDGDVLSEAQAVRLAEAGRTIEARFGWPQDIEWCLADDRFWFVQSRPITTLFPIPEVDDGDNHVYVSVGHQQMMTDAMKPLGLSFWQMTTPRPMREAGGRLFVDVAAALATPSGRETIIGALGQSDPLIGDALEKIVERGFIPSLPDEKGMPVPDPMSAGDSCGPLPADPAVTDQLITLSEASLATLKREIRARSGPELLEFIRGDIEELRRNLFRPRSQQVIRETMKATWWLNERIEEWIGERNAGDALTRSAPGDVSAEMGMDLLDVADQIRPHPQVISFLERVEADGPGAERDFLGRLSEIEEGGAEAAGAIRSYLERYGMRCTGEIDITRPRFSERPETLLPVILQNVRNARPGEAGRRYDEGLREVAQRERDLMERLRELPDGESKVAEARRNIDLVRAFTGYREYPKYGMVSRYFVYKQALLEEAGRLVEADVLEDGEDIFFLRFDELEAVARTGEADHGLIRRRQQEFDSYGPLVPPRVMTSEGEAVSGAYRRDDMPAGALAGLAVSAGIVEGRARVIADVAAADPEPGDILVTAFTDPSWAPVFIGISGLITEVGGMMTHGAVVAREYGLPAVVGVEGATEKIRDGQRIRLNGIDGYVELLSE